jgi:ribonuclease III
VTPSAKFDFTDPEFPMLAPLADRLEWAFSNPVLLRRAMAHRSWCAEKGEESNERLEFLGDAVLGLVVTNYIYLKYPRLPEGDLAKLRAGVVNSIVLAEIAAEMHLGEALLLGKGELATGGRQKTSILADALEAVIGAVYLDGGFPAAEQLVMRLMDTRIDLSADGPGGHDYKTRLQELVAREFEQLPAYRTTDQGPDHAKEFQATVHVMGKLRGEGAGRSKKQAEQAAAQQAWRALSAELAANAIV